MAWGALSYGGVSAGLERAGKEGQALIVNAFGCFWLWFDKKDWTADLEDVCSVAVSGAA